MNTIERTINQDDILHAIQYVFEENQGTYNNIDFEEVKKSITMLINYLTEGTPFNSNILIYSENQELANRYGVVIAEAIERLIVGGCRIFDGKYYSTLNLAHSDYSERILILTDFNASNPAEVYNALSTIEGNLWPKAVILCTTIEGCETLRAFDAQDFRLFNYLCGSKIFIPGADQTTIAPLVYDYLREFNLTVTSSFKERLELYIKAVYPSACLSKNDFANDLVYRILRTHYQKKLNNPFLEAADVPYSEKLELMLVEMEREEYYEEIEDEQDEYLSRDELDNEQPEQEIAPIGEKGEKEGAIVLFLSKYKEEYLDSEEQNYPYEIFGKSKNSRIEYKGRQTNEAPVRCLMSLAQRKNIKISKIIYIRSDEVKESNIKGTEEKQAEYFEKWCKSRENFRDVQYIDKDEEKKALNYNEDIEVVGIDYEENGVVQYHNIFKGINKELEGIDNLFIDATGGMRNINYLMISMIRFLEFKDKNCQYVIYSENPENGIKNITYIYNMISLISGVESFIRSGRSDELKDAYKRYNSFIKLQKNQYTGCDLNFKNLLDSVIDFANALSVCNINGIILAVKNIKDKIDIIKNNPLETNKVDQRLDIIFGMMEDLVETISSKLYLDKMDLTRSDYCIWLTKWCCENNMPVQALAIIESKLPEFMFKSGILSIDFNTIKKSFDEQFNTEMEKYRNREKQDLYTFKNLPNKILKDKYLKQSLSFSKDVDEKIVEYYHGVNFIRNKILHGNNSDTKKGVVEQELQRIIEISERYMEKYYNYEKDKIEDIQKNYNKIENKQRGYSNRIKELKKEKYCQNQNNFSKRRNDYPVQDK